MVWGLALLFTNDEMMNYNIGLKVRLLRRARKLTLMTVARETGFSTALISQIENNKICPSVATLSKIARFFDVKIAHFFEDEKKEILFDVVRTYGQRSGIGNPGQAERDRKIYCESMTAKKRYRKMEPFLVSGQGTGAVDLLNVSKGEKFVFVLKGRAGLLFNSHQLELNEGDGIYLDSSLRCQLSSSDGGEVSIVALVAR
ncbi:XRE family transcriptional regulator [Desulfuromonas thiophila]|nr:XRE family transcriptional regulator [Desulfuromonas thiophila]